jgi:PAS domain S-box-containing protein
MKGVDMTTTPLNARFVLLLKSFSRYASLAVVIIAAIAFFGRVFDIAALKNAFPGFATMRANTALAFIIAGLALFLSNNNPQSRQKIRIIAWGLALFVTFFSLLNLFEYWSGWDIGIDQLLFRDLPTSNATYPGRMSIITASDFTMIGFAVFFLDVGSRRSYRTSQIFALVVGSSAFVALIGYIYGVESPTGVGPYLSMAFHSALSFTLLSLAILCARPEDGLMRIVSSNTAGGGTLRRLLPVVIFAPIILGWLGLQGHQGGLYDTTFGVVLLVLSMMVLLGITIWLNAGMLNASELNRQQAEERFRLVVEAAPTAMIMVDARGKIQIANIHTREMFGYQHEELLGKSVDLLVPERFRSKHAGFRQGYFAESQARAMGVGRDLFGVRKDGQEFPIEIGLNPVQTPGELFTLAAIIDITERKKIEADMKQSMDELARSNAELEQFAYVASHDLQEPLRMVSSYVQLLARRYQGRLDSDADEFIAFAVDGAARMKILINDLLSFSRVGTRGRQFAPVILEETLNQAMHNLALVIDESGATITHDPLPQVMADDGQMLQLLQNLIGNALKFRGETPPKVHIGVKRKKDRWQFYVRDNGIGIDPQFWDRIFIIFQRLHNREEYDGTGIGLAICRKIVERHGGRIWVESELGQGSTFYFTLNPVEGTAIPVHTQETSIETGKILQRETIADRASDLI